MALVRLLGPIDLVDDSGAVHSPRSALRRTMLALLALHTSKVLTADWLLENLWGGQPPDSGLRALRFHISQLRKELGAADLIETGDASYRLTLSPEQVDVLTLDGAASAARGEVDRGAAADMYAEVLARWRGAP